jgi:quercetin dioxygenase-like cupin family protein
MAPERTVAPTRPAGTWVENVKTKELGRLRVSPDETEGRRLVADLWLQPGAAVLGEHVHDHLLERFTVIAGTLSTRLDGVEGQAGAGDVIEIPAGIGHDWWNDGDEVVHARVDVETVPGSAPMAVRFLEMIEVAFGLANSGHTNEEGRPTLLWLAAFAMGYRDVLRLTKPPLAVQRALFEPLAALARRRGRDPGAAWLHGPGAPCEVPEPVGFTGADSGWLPALELPR